MVEGIGGQSFQIQLPQELPGSQGPSALPGAAGAGEAKASGSTESFGATFKHFLGEVNDLQLQSDQTMQAFLRGDVTDLHQVVIAQQEAGIALRLVGEMRDRLLSSYQEVMRMSV